MKTAFITLAVVSLVAAQNLVGQPPCAATCLKPAILKNCAAEDVGCQCGSGKAAIQADSTTCLVAACSGADLASALSVGNALCSSYSATAGATGGATKSSTPASTTAAPTVTGTASNGTTKSNGTTALSTSAKPTAASSSAGSATTKSSSAGAAPTLIASIGGLVALVGGMVAAL
ncbi:hypothetical protein BGZ60DRAFT_409579 [Tricladium varicosporioides]|nr:hypothetical protein BGZ60DRAFT_409579 [Hymenoscyphus varicosporioides]